MLLITMFPSLTTTPPFKTYVPTGRGCTINRMEEEQKLSSDVFFFLLISSPFTAFVFSVGGDLQPSASQDILIKQSHNCLNGILQAMYKF